MCTGLAAVGGLKLFARYFEVILKSLIFNFPSPPPTKQCYNSGSTLDGSTSTLCWGLALGVGGGGGTERPLSWQKGSVPRLWHACFVMLITTLWF